MATTALRIWLVMKKPLIRRAIVMNDEAHMLQICSKTHDQCQHLWASDSRTAAIMKQEILYFKDSWASGPL